jgi:hypothetical protein
MSNIFFVTLYKRTMIKEKHAVDQVRVLGSGRFEQTQIK